MDERSFPANMERIWDRHFGDVRRTGQPVVIGEMGGTMLGLDRAWQQAA